MPRRYLDPAPTARFLHRAACGTSDAGRWLYVFGGRGEFSEFNDLWILDKQRAGGDALGEKSGGGATSAAVAAATTGGSGSDDGSGGSGSDSPTTVGVGTGALLALGPAWRHVEVESAPPQRQSPTLTAVGSRLLMFGGRQGEVTFLNDCWIFDTLVCAWTCVRESDDLPPWGGAFGHNQAQSPTPVRPSPRWAHSAVAFGNAVLVFGGSAPGTCFNDLHWFDMRTLAWRRQTVERAAYPPARSGHCACALGEDYMYVFGGNTTERSFNDLWEFRVPSATWQLIKASAGHSPCARVGHTLTALGSRLLVLGGREYSTNHFDPSLHTFNVTSKQWREVPLAEAGGGRTSVRTGHCATVHAGRLLLFGGLDDRNLLLDDLMSVSLIE